MDNIICKLCGKECLYLGSHLWFRHKMLSREYKEVFELDYKYPLISPEVKEKKRLAFEANREYYLANLLKAGKKYRFKKGHTSLIRISQQSDTRNRNIINRVNLNAYGACPICKTKYAHMKSHLYNAHGLVVASK